MARTPPTTRPVLNFSIDSINAIIDSIDADDENPRLMKEVMAEMAHYVNSLPNSEAKAQALNYLFDILQSGMIERYISFIGPEFKSNFSEDVWPCLLGLAIKLQDIKIFNFLLKKGLDVNYNKDVNTPLIKAIFDCREYFMKELLKHGADVNLPNQNNLSPLKAALTSHRDWTMDRVYLLINAGAKLDLDTLNYAKEQYNAQETVPYLKDLLEKLLIKLDKENIDKVIKPFTDEKHSLNKL